MSITIKNVTERFARVLPDRREVLSRVRNLHELDLVLDALLLAQGKTGVRLSFTGHNKIGVIKAIRQYTKLGLKESKELADKCSPQHENYAGGEAVDLFETVDFDLATNCVKDLQAVGAHATTYKVGS